MSRKARHRLIIVLLWVALTPSSIELLLERFDPWGMVYFDDQEIIKAHLVKTEGRYYLPEGYYHFAHWSATVRLDNTRVLPDAHSGSCRVALLGDSTTWGYGVNDAETWTNLIAADLPDATLRNYAFNGYDIREIETTYRALPPEDVVVYLVFSNDDNDPFNVTPSSAPFTDISQIVRYTLYAQGAYQAQGGKDRAYFDSALGKFRRDNRLTFVTFDSPFGRGLPAYVHLIPPYHSSISKVDPHPDAAGHREIAAAMLPIVRSAVERNCRPII